MILELVIYLRGWLRPYIDTCDNNQTSSLLDKRKMCFIQVKTVSTAVYGGKSSRGKPQEDYADSHRKHPIYTFFKLNTNWEI
jgi:hypothetical protein